jgi:hypothetical protein
MEKIFTPEFLKEIGFKLVYEKISEYKPNLPYGYAVDRCGMTHIYWNESGHGVTYFGDPLEPNISMSIRKDADTRYAFNGYVFNQDDVRKLLKLTL